MSGLIELLDGAQQEADMNVKDGWATCELPPLKAGVYLVWRDGETHAFQARYMPKKERWIFPSASMAFEPTHWKPMPEPPNA